MTFQGIDRAGIRADLIAYLKQAMTSGQQEQVTAGGVPGDADLEARPGKQGAVDHLLPRHISRHHGGRSNAALLGAKLAVQDRFERDRTRQGRACDFWRRYARRSGVRHLQHTRRDESVHPATMLRTSPEQQSLRSASWIVDQYSPSDRSTTSLFSRFGRAGDRDEGPPAALSVARSIRRQGWRAWPSRRGLAWLSGPQTPIP